MEFKYYSIWCEFKNEEMYVMGNKVDCKLYEGVGEFVNGELIQSYYAVTSSSQIHHILNTEYEMNKSLDFINKLARKIEKVYMENMMK